MAGNSSQWSGVGPNFQQRGGVQEGHHRWWPLNKEGERFVRLRRSNDEYRYWLYAANPPPSKHERFTIVSYNILAVDNARAHWRELYYHIPSHVMQWNTRKRKLLQELGLWSPDIICLQEVDRYDDLNKRLQDMGFTGVYKGRTGMATDGCAIFWRPARFQLLHEENIEFRELDLRDNVAQLCVLQMKNRNTKAIKDEGATQASKSGSTKGGNNCVVVGNIHVLFNPKRGDVKLGQVRVLLEKAHSLSQEWGGAPVVIAGDFNSTPLSAVYHYISTSELDVSQLDRKQLSGQDDNDNCYTQPAQQLPISEVNRDRYCSNSQVLQDDEPLREEVIEVGSMLSMETVEVETSTRSYEEEDLEVKACQTSTTQISRSSFDFSFQSGSSRKADPIASQRVCCWSPEELKAATGSEQQTVVRHDLLLQSSYAQIEGKAGSRDDMGEPLVTTYHRKFMGTVDYIWHTDGLFVVRVLDTLPVDVLERSHGLPSQKWGSDHLALACELAFMSG
ncbi:hypothetical protein BDL97_13G024800 [Sphagnum fallax]|nr:hypothetical protein BDL97_13G024800 [Sphagnum fallax]